jgi:hypothetical protein
LWLTAKSNCPLGGDVDFYSNIWDISTWLKKKGDSHRVSIHFWNWENRNLRNDGLVSMAEPLYLSLNLTLYINFS